MPKIKVLVKIKNINQQEKLEIIALFKDDTLKYLEKDNTKVTIDYSNLIMIRENNTMRMEFKFDTTKKILGKIKIKEANKEVLIPIQTTKIQKKGHNLKVEYHIDNQKFLYQVEEIK